MDKKIGFIGAGNIASAMIRAAVEKGILQGSQIMVINKKNKERLERLQKEYGVIPARSLKEMAAACSTMVICVKPNQVSGILDDLANQLHENHLIISVAAGIPLHFMQARLGQDVAVIRAMPNTPVQAGEGAIALSAGPSVSGSQKALANEIFSQMGKVVWVQEKDMDIITALSGSGPAYFYWLAAEISRVAGTLGLDPKLAKDLSAQTLIGAGYLLKSTGADVEDLLREVVSPNGTTAAALRVFESRHLQCAIEEAMLKAVMRSQELSGLPERHILSKARKIVVKVGSSTIADQNGKLNERLLRGLVAQIARLVTRGCQVILVSSGAVACGRGKIPQELSSSISSSITDKQALAAVGQALLMHIYESLFEAHGITVAQVLLTKEDLASPRRCSLCENTLRELLARKIVPIVNENDTVAVDQIKFGDNDTLSARVAVLIDADLLVILTDTDGLYTRDPKKALEAEQITRIKDINPELLEIAGESNGVGTGGMLTKLWAANIALEHGIPTVIADGARDNVLELILEGEEIGTFFSRESYSSSTVQMGNGHSSERRIPV